MRTEPGHDDAAIRRRRRAGVGRFDVPLVARLPFERGALPDDCARALVDRVEHPLVAGEIVRGITVAVEARLERSSRLAADRARHNLALAPDNAAGVTAAW